MKPQNLFFLPILACLLLLAQCEAVQTPSNDTPQEEKMPQLPEDIFTFDSETFNAQRAAWEAQEIAEYSFTCQVDINRQFTPVAALIDVENGAVTITTDGAAFNARVEELSAVLDTTISGLYAKLAALAEKARQDCTVGALAQFSLKLYFSEARHYPTGIYYTYKLPGHAESRIDIEIAQFSIPGEEPIGSYQFDEATFEQERALWNAQNLDVYSYVAELRDIARAVALVEITGGRTSTFRAVEGESEYIEAYSGTSISQMYDKLATRAREGKARYEAKQIRQFMLKIEYDQDFHYPVSVVCTENDFLYAPSHAYLSMSINEFTPTRYQYTFVFDRDKFSEERAAWEALGLANYSYTCTDIYTNFSIESKVVVLNNEVTSAIDATFLGDTLGTGNMGELYRRLEENAEYARRWYDSEEHDIKNFTLDIDYDPVYHIPLKAHYYWQRVGSVARITQFHLTFSNFTAE